MRLILFVTLIAGVNAQPLTRAGLQDGSGFIGLAPGWRITASVNAMVSAAGPEGHVDLGLNVQAMTPEAAAGFPMRPPVVATYGHPAQDWIHFAVYTQLAPPGSITIVERAPYAGWNGPGEMAVLSNSQTGEQCLAAILEAPTGPGQFLLYVSQVCAPRAQFANSLPVLLRIWSSWKTGDYVFQYRLRQAALSLRCVTEMIRRVNRRRSDAYEDANEAWDRIIRR